MAFWHFYRLSIILSKSTGALRTPMFFSLAGGFLRLLPFCFCWEPYERQNSERLSIKLTPVFRIEEIACDLVSLSSPCSSFIKSLSLSSSDLNFLALFFCADLSLSFSIRFVSSADTVNAVAGVAVELNPASPNRTPIRSTS